MIKERFIITSRDGAKISCVRWLPDHGPAPAAVLQIVHGMAEHIDRYADFAGFCVEKGFAVYGHDHRGHGKTAEEGGTYGYLADKNGWDLTVSDIGALRRKAHKDFPGEPYFLLGHSMGSFLTRTYIAREPEELSGVIISGTGHTPGILAMVLELIAGGQSLLMGKRRKSRLCDSLSFSAYNKYFEPAETPFDWLSRDREIVKTYVGDPACGFVCTAGFYIDLARGLRFIASKRAFRSVPEDLPLLFVSGDCDPVGNMGKGVSAVVDRYIKRGIRDLTLHFNRNGRHESLNETNRTEIYELILNWIRERGVQKKDL